MRRSKGHSHPVARRAAIASMTILTASGVGLVAAPMAFGQNLLPIGLGGRGVTVANSGSGTANSGGNTAVGNGSSNTATSSSSGGGLLDVPITVGAPNNTSDGTAAVNTGPASAAGNSSGTGVGQSTASGGQVRQNQSAGVFNAGSANADSGGNTAVGNASTNRATVNQDVTGGLVGVGVNIGGPTNNSTGSATVNSGAANAVGNTSSTDVGHASRQGAGACGARFARFLHADVSNHGQAVASTGNNTAIGNASVNDASVVAPQTVTGGLVGIGLTIGGPVNNSSGDATINTGPATAVGNVSETTVTRSAACPDVRTAVTGGGKVGQARPGTLARTGLRTGDLGMIAGALLGAGMLIIAGQRRRVAARRVPVAMGGFGAGLGAEDWDRVVR